MLVSQYKIVLHPQLKNIKKIHYANFNKGSKIGRKIR
jgi:hypothetical protein